MADTPEPPPAIPEETGAGSIQFPGEVPAPAPQAPDEGIKLPEGGPDIPSIDFEGPPAVAPDAPAEEKTYFDLLKSLNLVINQLAIYPDRHPRVRQLLEETLAMLKGFLEHASQLTFGLTEGKLFIEEQLMEEAQPGVTRFIGYFKKLEVDALTFLPGLELPELIALVKVLGLKPERIEAQGGVRTLLPADALPHLHLEKAHYERVLDGQMVTASETTEQGGPAAPADAQGPNPPSAEQVQHMQQAVEKQRTAAPKKTLFETLQDYLEGKIEEFPPDFDVKALITEAAKNPKRMVALMLQVGRAIQSLQTVVERVGRWLATWAQTEGFKSKVNPSELMLELGRALQQELLSPEATDLIEQAGSMESLGAMVSQFADIIKTNLVVAKYQASRKKPSEFKKFVSSMLENEEERDRLLPEIAKKLKEAGLSDEELNKLIARVKETQVGEGMIKISRAELQRLQKMEQLAKQPQGAAAPSETAPRPVAEMVQRAELERIFAQIGQRKPAVPAQPDATLEMTQDEASQLRSKAEKLDWLLNRKEKIDLKGFIEAHRAVAQELDQLNRLVHDLAQGVVVVDPQDKVVLMNRAAEDLLGVRMEQAIGRHVLERLRDEHVVGLGRRGQNAGGAAEIQQLELAHAAPERQTLKASTAVVEDTQGRTVGMLFILSDVQKQQELEQVKRKFLSRLKDDLRAPLTALHDALVLILGGTAGDLTEDQRRLATQAVEHTARLTHSVDELLDFAKLQRSELKAQRRALSIGEVLTRATALFQSWAQEKQMVLECRAPEPPITVVGDPDQLDRLFATLIANAVNFTPAKGRVTITAEPAERTDPKAPPMVQVSVHDTGRGIASSDLATIFEPFNAATGAGTGGTGLGLGLAIAKEIAKLHNGRMAAESELGVGSKFTVLLPIAPAAPTPKTA